MDTTKIESEDLDLSNFNLLASDAVVSENQGEIATLEPTVFTSDPETKSEPGIKDKRTSKEPELKLQKVDSLEEILEKEEETQEEIKEETKEEKEEEEEKEEDETKDKKEETSEETSEETDDEDEDASPFKTFATFLHDNGIADYDPEDFEDSETGLLKMMDKTVKNAIQKYKESVPTKAAAFLEYLEAGGDPKTYIESSQSVPDYKGLSEDLLTKESVQKALLTDWMRLQGYSDTDVVESLKDYEESGLLEKQSKMIHPKLIAKQQEYEENLVVQQKQHHQEQIDAHKSYVEGVKKSIEDKDEIAGFELSKRKKDDFFKYITESDKEGKTRLLQDIEADSDSQLKMAWLMYNKFDFSNIEKKIKTKISGKLRDSLSNIDSTTKMSGSSKRKKKATDTQEMDFSAWKKLL